MSFVMRAQITALAAILVVGAGAASVESTDCDDESFICAKGSPWYQATEATIRISSAGSSDYEQWRFMFPDAHSLSLDLDTKVQGRSETGKILLLSGRVMLTKGFSPAKGYEIDALDLPILNYQLVVTLLSQAFPSGPDKFAGKHTVDLAEQKRGIRIATTSAEGRYPSPWGLKGEMERRSVETIGFSFTFSYVAGAAQHSVLINGEWKKTGTSPRLDPSMSLEGWGFYTLGGISIKRKGATIFDYGAQSQPTSIRTLGELQESIRKQKASSKERR